jgi:hypothetical protein
MKFLQDFTKYLSERKSKTAITENEQLIDNKSEEVASINEEFNATQLEFKIIVVDASKEEVKAQYAVFYNGKEFTKGNAVFKRSTEGGDYFLGTFELKKAEYPVTGSFDIHVSRKDAKNGAKLVAKIGQTNASSTGIFNTELKDNGGGVPPIPIEPFESNLGNFFAPNVDTIDETKKNELNNELTTLNDYFTKHKDALRKPGAPIIFNVIGGASQVTTTYAGGNQKLAEARANNLKTYMITYFKTSNPDLSRYIGQVAQVTTVIGKTPYVQGKDNPQDPKFLAEQFVKVSIKFEGK